MNDGEFALGFNDPIALLGEFGLTRQEATVYVGLLAEGELNGYEAAKSLGLSRSNAYTALSALVGKGAAWTLEGSPVRYTAVPAREFCDNRVHELESARARLLASLPSRRESSGGYVTIRGEKAIMDRLRHLVADANERVYLALHGATLRLLFPELRVLLATGKKLVVITDRATGADESVRAFFAGAELYAGNAGEGKIRAIADSRFVLTGELSGGEYASCLYSDQKNLADVFKDALRNEITLIGLDSAEIGGNHG